MLITRKIEIGVNRISEEAYKTAWNFIRYIDDNLYKAANDIVSHQYFNHELRQRLQISHPDYRKTKKEIEKIDEKLISTIDREQKKILYERKKEFYIKLKEYDEEVNKQYASILNTSVQNSTYQVISEGYPLVPSNIRNTLNSVIQQSYKAAFKDLMQGKRSLPTYRKGLPIPFQFKSDFIREADGEISFVWLNGIAFHLRFGRDRSNNRSIIEKIINGQYKAKDSSIQLKDTKLFLLLVVDIGNVDNNLNDKICVGVDTGLNIPLFAALNEGQAGMAIGNRDEFLNVRLRLQAKRKNLQRSLRDNQGGKGRNKKLSALDKASQKEKNFVHTQNHLFSKKVIEFALKHNAGTIKMEKLEGIGEDLQNKFLTRNWSYFEMQKLIAYKAKYHNIHVEYVNPRNTSKTCSFCGNLEEGQRLNQKDFLCKNPNCSNKNESGENTIINADYNGARNIAKSTDIVK